MRVKTFVKGRVETNCYVVFDDHKCIVVDCEEPIDEMVAFIKEQNLEVKALLLTHGHFDHIGGVEHFRELFGCKVYGGLKEKEMFANPLINLSREFGVSCDEYVSEGSRLLIDDIEIRVLETPGHTDGSVCYIIDDLMFSGDTLFKCAYGRYDLPTGSFSKLKKSLHRLFALDGDYLVYPGHGDSTTLAAEREFNPLRGV